MNTLMRTSIILLFATAAIAVSCAAKTEVIPAFQAGSAVGVCRVGASGGEVSVLVETQGQWRLRTEDSWISTDVTGGDGRGAFTFHFQSNESDILNLKPGRIGRIAICLESTGKADTLLVVQSGFLTPYSEIPVTADPALKLEFDDPSGEEVKLLVAASAGASSSAVAEWAMGYGADICILDGNVIGSANGLNVLGCNYEGMGQDQRYNAFKDAVLYSMSQTLTFGNDWIVCGQMYHYSAMQVGYPDTPSWYPSDASGEEFREDRYAWQNNMYDLLWMKTQGWVETYKDEDGRSWQADYVYVSASVLDKASSVEIVPVPVSGMMHNPVMVVLNI